MESEKFTLPVCEELIKAGVTNVMERIADKLLRLSIEGNIAAGMVFHFIENLRGGSENPIVLEFNQMIFNAVDDDPEFINEFSTRTMKMTIDFFSRKAHEASVEGLVGKFDNV